MSIPAEESGLPVSASEDFLSIEEVRPLFTDWYEMNPPLAVEVPYGTTYCIICGAPNHECSDYINRRY